MDDLPLGASETIRLAVEKIYPGENSTRAKVAREMLTSIAEKCIRDKERMFPFGHDNEEVAETLHNAYTWEQARQLITEVDEAIYGRKDWGIDQGQWSIPEESTIRSEKIFSSCFDMPKLSRVAIEYVEKYQDYSHTLEIFLTAALMHAEAYSTANHPVIQSANEDKQPKLVTAWRLIVWAIAITTSISASSEFGATIGTLVFSAWCFLIARPGMEMSAGRHRISIMLGSMRAACRVARRRPPCPAEVEDFLKTAEHHGAIWPEGLRPLVASARRRDPVRWLT